jgi:hypothetical protein
MVITMAQARIVKILTKKTSKTVTRPLQTRKMESLQESKKNLIEELRRQQIKSMLVCKQSQRTKNKNPKPDKRWDPSRKAPPPPEKRPLVVE